MRQMAWLAGASALVLAAPAMAGDTVLYGPPPNWVDSAQKTFESTAKNPLQLFDVQQRIEDGTLATYFDQAFLLNTPQSLTQGGTTAAQWLPDKGDLTVHRVEILRGKETIDVLAGGARYTVLRRETNLENRVLDGALTATMAVPGLRVGDILRVAYTLTVRDPVLGGNVQAVMPLISEPISVGFARAQVSWPASDTVRWKAGRGVTGAQEETIGGYRRVTVKLPLPKPEPMPEDAPRRYHRPVVLQAGTFANWEEVSRLFAPLYVTAGTIAPGSALDGEVARIAAASTDPRERAALATQLVQDRIGYLLNGMDSGNYTPQAPAETWKARYGDCKAKALLLLAMLERLGIAAQPVLVHTALSDATPDMQPMPAAFDHVIVRATIGGQNHWLDGTSAGTRLSNLSDTPPFRTVLPLVPQGAGLMRLEPRTPALMASQVDLTIDQRAGVELPALLAVKARFTGAPAAQLSAAYKQASADQAKSMGEAFVRSISDDISLTNITTSFDDAAGTAAIDFEGLMSSGWRAEGARMRRALQELDSSGIAFSPNRTRASWRDIPVELGAPEHMAVTVRLLLPESTAGYELTGTHELDVTYAGRRVTRQATLSDSIVTVTETFASPGGELAPGDIAAEKQKAARIANSAPAVIAPADADRLWQYGRSDLRKRLAPIERAYAAVIARHPEEALGYLNRARYRRGVFDFRGAIADFDKAIALDPETDYHGERGGVYYALGDLEKAVADFRRSHQMAPSVKTALELAALLGESRASDEALALLGEYDTRGEEHADIVKVRADILAWAGRAEEGHAELQALIADKPGQGPLLNADCWYRARFNVGTETMLSVCNEAVEKSGEGAAALDSRSLALFRMGDMKRAKDDAEAALALQPGQYVTRYVLAHANRALGERAGADFIRYFDQTWPGLAKVYASYGLKP